MSAHGIEKLKPGNLMVSPRTPITAPPPPPAAREALATLVAVNGRNMYQAEDGTYFSSRAQAERHNALNEAMGYTGLPLQRVRAELAARPQTIHSMDTMPGVAFGTVGQYCYVTTTRKLYQKVGARSRMGSPHWDEVGDIGQLEAEINRENPRSNWELHIMMLRNKRAARIETWWGAHGSSKLKSYWNFVKAWWWKKQTRKLLAEQFTVGRKVKIKDESLCWLGRSGEIVEPNDGGAFNSMFCDLVYVKLFGGCIGARDYTVRCSIYELEVMDGTAAEFERRRWVSYIDSHEWGTVARTVRENEAIRQDAKPDTPPTLDAMPEPVIEPVHHKSKRRLVI